MQKKIKIWGPWDHDWGMFCGYFDDVIIRYNEPILSLKVFFDSRLEYESSDPLVEFIAFPVQKLCQKKSKHFRNFLRNLGDFP